jgi:hypothetical protein
MTCFHISKFSILIRACVRRGHSRNCDAAIYPESLTHTSRER